MINEVGKLPADECATLAPAGSFRRCNVCRGRADYLCSEPVLRYARGFLRQPEERWMMGDCLIFCSPDVEGVPGIGWHRVSAAALLLASAKG